VRALQRFGICGKFLKLIESIYECRSFAVKDGPLLSTSRLQEAGIAQGCPLSPYLFVILMSVVMADARSSTSFVESRPYIVTSDLVYADDTMIIASSAAHAQSYLDAVTETGKTYGLELNLKKTVLLRLRGDEDVVGFDGKALQVKTEAVYLGGLINIHGLASPELGRRIGEARGVFRQLVAVWKHANIPLKRKYAMLDACVMSKLLYCLESLWILADGLKRLDGFFASCLRQIAGIKHSYYSRVASNRAGRIQRTAVVQDTSRTTDSTIQ